MTSAKNTDQDAEAPRLEYRFLLSGTRSGDAERLSLQDELAELIESVVHLNLLSVNQGLQLDLEVASTAPFSAKDYEAYLVDHVLMPALSKIGGDFAQSVHIKPLRGRRP